MNGFKFQIRSRGAENWWFWIFVIFDSVRGFADDTRDVKIVGMISEDFSLRWHFRLAPRVLLLLAPDSRLVSYRAGQRIKKIYCFLRQTEDAKDPPSSLPEFSDLVVLIAYPRICNFW